MASAATYIAWNRNSARNVVWIRLILTRLYSPIDSLAAFETDCQNGSTTPPVRYAIRQALDQEYQKHLLRQRADARQDKYKAGGGLGSDADPVAEDIENASTREHGVHLKPIAVKRDFFGRIINVARPMARGHSGHSESEESWDSKLDGNGKGRKVWVSFHEGFSNAVRKPITLDELMRGFEPRRRNFDGVELVI